MIPTATPPLATATVDFPKYDERIRRPAEEKNPEFQHDGHLRHLINAGQLTPDLVNSLCNMADQIRLLSRDRHSANALRELLSHRRAMLYFTQPSTRTFLSFMAACQILGLTCNEVRDPKTSSEVKRESRMDAIRMFSSYFDIIIMRSPLASFAEACSYLMTDLASLNKRWVPIINAGAGADEHPTQALLDIYTLKRTFNFTDRDGNDTLRELQSRHPDLGRGLSNKTYTFCGDIGRGRTVRSLAIVLAQYDGIRMNFVSPDDPSLRLHDDLRDRLTAHGVQVREYHSLDDSELLGQTDCLYMTRIQREHNSPNDEFRIRQLDLSLFQLTPERAAQLKEFTPIMHPFPRDSEVQEIPEAIDVDPRAMYFRQARNGMWIRAALLVHMFDMENELEALAAGGR
ncbi:MAG: aspartate/ornithine carbamoyltransferase family protein [Pirellulaceae bacterium]